MKLISSSRAPSPRRVRIFLAEKGIEIPTRNLDLGKGEHFAPEFLALNPDAVVPCLVLDDGRAIAESVAICRYFEAANPEPPLFGRDPYEQAQVEAWTRRVEHQGYHSVQHFLRNQHPAFEGRALPGIRGGVEQIPALAERAAKTFARTLDKVEAQLEAQAQRQHTWLATGDFTMADIMLLTTVDFARRCKLPAAVSLDGYPRLLAWHTRASQRPSAEA